jgi:hypothetical protein
MLASKHNPNGGASPHFDNVRLESLIAAHQTGSNPAALAEIVSLTQERALTLIRFHKTIRYRPEDELLSDVNFKLLRAVEKFDPAKGSAFTFVSRVVMNVLCTSVTNARKSADRYLELNEGIANNLAANVDSQARDAIDDLVHRIRSNARTTLTDALELSAQRWYVESFTEDGFESRRHQCANAAMAVYNLSHGRSRELFDLTMLEVRRILYDDLKRREPIIARPIAWNPMRLDGALPAAAK